VKLCGQELTKTLPGLESTVIANYKHADTFECHNRPGPPQCSFEYAYEYTTTTVLQFAADPSGSLHLEALMFVDGGSLSDVARKAEEDWMAAQLARLAKQPCPSSK
jgi:hypothetical protein